MTTYKLYDGKVELDFNDKKHVYSIDGEVIPSVTGICKIIDKSGPLMWWAVSQALEYVKENAQDLDYDDEVQEADFWHQAQRAHLRASKKATDIGHLAHSWIECHLNDEQPDLPYNEQLRSTVESFLEWEAENPLTLYETEFKVLSRKHYYAGTCDYDGMVGVGTKAERCIVDWKTGKAVYPEHWMQTAAYQCAREEELGVHYDARWVIVLPKDGGKIIAERRGREHYVEDLKAFLNAKGLTTWLKK